MSTDRTGRRALLDLISISNLNGLPSFEYSNSCNCPHFLFGSYIRRNISIESASLSLLRQHVALRATPIRRQCFQAWWRNSNDGRRSGTQRVVLVDTVFLNGDSSFYFWNSSCEQRTRALHIWDENCQARNRGGILFLSQPVLANYIQ